MSQAELLPRLSVSLPPITYKGQPVVTTEMLAQAYGCETIQIQQNFLNNKGRFIEGKHYYLIKGQELRELRLQLENFEVQISPKARHLQLYTERGSLYHAKSIGTDQAWAVYEVLVETFFRVVKAEEPTPEVPAQPALESPDAPITPDQQCTLQAIVKAKIEAIPKAERSNGLYPQVWGRFKNHFRVAKYDQLPQSRMREAVAYLSTMEVRQKALPEPEKPNLPVPRVSEEEAKSRALKARMEAIHKGAYAVYDELCAEVLLHRRRGDTLGITEVSALSAMINSIKAAKYAMESVAYAHNWVSYGHLARTGVAMSEWNHECARSTMKRFREEMDLMIGKEAHAGISSRL